MIKKYKEFIPPAISGGLIILGIGIGNVIPSITPYIFILAFLVGGYKPASIGIKSTLQNKKLNVELLMILAAIGAILIGYWEEGSVLIFIFALSGALEDYATDKNKREIQKLMDFQPETAHRIIDGNETIEVSIDELIIGDVLLVRKGDAVPIDGKIVEGTSSMNEATITGEPMPKEKSIGDEVFGATINEISPIKMEVTKLAEDTLVRKIIKMVEESQGAPSKAAKFINRIEDTYVKAVLLLVAVMLFLPHFAFGWSWQDTFYRAMVLLVVASPCALVASVSPATLSAISNGAKNGVLVKGGVHLENLQQMKAISFDKTGTLTYGTPKVTTHFVIDEKYREEFNEALVSLESYSTHPLALSIVKELTPLLTATVTLNATELEDIAGYGIKGIYKQAHWKIGKKALMDAHALTEKLEGKARFAAKKGQTIVYVQRDDEVLGFLGLQDVVREDAKILIKKLKDQSIEPIMITGDNAHTAQAIATELGISRVVPNALPDQKAMIIQDLKTEFGTIAMVGDGVNDAPALAYADVGIAMGHGTDIAIEAADIVLMRDDISKIDYAIQLSQKLKGISTFNIVFSLSVIIILIFSNMFQWINLPLGVIGHEGSTILVILNGLRLLSFKAKNK